MLNSSVAPQAAYRSCSGTFVLQTVRVSREIVPVDSQIADVISDVISRATSGSGRSTSGFGLWHSIATFSESSCLARRS